MIELLSFYKNLKRAVKRNLILYFVTIVVLMALLSVFLGPPFSKTVTVAGFLTYQVDGWFWEKNWLMYLIILVALMASVVSGGLSGFKNVKKLQNILYVDCDAERLLRIADEGIRYEPHAVWKNQKQARNVAKRQRRSFEQLYVESLQACGQVEGARLYLESGWQTKKNTLIYRQLSLGIQAHFAYLDQDASRYRSILEQSGRILKRSAIHQARLDWLEGRREQAARRLKNTSPRVPYEQVMFAALLSTYLREMGQVEEARKYADYVMEHGGTLALREAVREEWDGSAESAVGNT